MSEIDETPEPETVTIGDEEASEETLDNPEIPVNDAVEQHTAVVGEDEEDEPVWEAVPDGVDPADATEQRRGVSRPRDEDYR